MGLLYLYLYLLLKYKMLWKSLQWEPSFSMRSDGRRQMDRRQRDRRDGANSRFYSILRTRLIKTGRYNLHCSRRHKSATTALLCFTQYLCIADSDVQLNVTHTMNFCILTANDLCENTAMLRYTYAAYLFIL